MTEKEKGKEQAIPEIMLTIANSYLLNNCKNCPFWSIAETCNTVPLNCSWLGLYRHYKGIDEAPTVEERPNCVTCDHFGKCEGCEKGEEE